jgi:dTDP-4-amino-4,6-dideoxygalactose transaminase
MQFRDLQTQYAKLKPEIDAAIASVLNGGTFILGSKVAELEEKLAEYVGVKYCVSCANGSDALTLALMALGVSRGDAVFVPDFTFFATAGAAAFLGAEPVLVDIDLETFNICPASLERSIKKTLAEGKYRPKVIIPVDLFGLPADYFRIEEIAKKYNLLVLEDGAQGFGGAIGGKRACSFGDLGGVSFFPAKPLGCYGDGGAIFTDNPEKNALLRSLRTQGSSPSDKYDNRSIGVNSRLDALQAAILLVKFKAFVEFELNDVNKVAERYSERLKNIKEIVTPKIPESYYSSWAQYTILLPDRKTRDALQIALKEKGMPTMVYYPRGLHAQTAFKYMNLSDEDFPNTSDAANRVLSLPIHPYLSEAEMEQICVALVSALKL